MTITPERMQELANMSPEERVAELEKENPEIAEVFREMNRLRTHTITVDEDAPGMFKFDHPGTHEDVFFVDLCLAIGNYIGQNAKSLRQLKNMTEMLCDAATSMSSHVYITRNPQAVVLELLEEKMPGTIKELAHKLDPQMKNDCANCAKPCPLAGKRGDTPIANPKDVVCVHLRGPEGVN